MNAVCPFCGSTHWSVAMFYVSKAREHPTGRVWNVTCHECGAQGPDGLDDSEAMQLWKKREGDSE